MAIRTLESTRWAIFDALVDGVVDELLKHQPELRFAEAVPRVLEVFGVLEHDDRLAAMLNALVSATGARLERRTMNGRDLVNVSTPTDARVARWSPENERLAMERRAARTPDRPLDS